MKLVSKVSLWVRLAARYWIKHYFYLLLPSNRYFSLKTYTYETTRERIIHFCKLKSDIKPPNETNLMLHKVESAADKKYHKPTNAAIRHKEQSLTVLRAPLRGPLLYESHQAFGEANHPLTRFYSPHRTCFAWPAEALISTKATLSSVCPILLLRRKRILYVN